MEEVDPAGSATLTKGITEVQKTAEGSYTGKLDASAATDSSALDADTVKALGAQAKALPFTAKLDAQGRLTELVISVPAAGETKAHDIKVTYADYGSATASVRRSRRPTRWSRRPTRPTRCSRTNTGRWKRGGLGRPVSAFRGSPDRGQPDTTVIVRRGDREQEWGSEPGSVAPAAGPAGFARRSRCGRVARFRPPTGASGDPRGRHALTCLDA